MKKSTLSIGAFSFVLMTIMFLSSCSTVSVTSRRYNKGLHFEWAKTSNSKSNETVTPKRVRNSSVECDVVAAEGVVEVENVNTLLVQDVELDMQHVNEVVASKSNSVKLFNSLKILKDDGSNFSINDFETNSLSKKTVIKAIKGKSSAETDTIILVLLSLLIPPLAVYLYEGAWTGRCTLNLILTILCGLPGVIHALVVILGNK